MAEQSAAATVIGAGLAGCEAAYALAARGIEVNLYDMKPMRYSPAHKSPLFAELVCSNSLRSDSVDNAVGLLKEEMRRIGSLVMTCADATRVPAGGALAVDRDRFSSMVTEMINAQPNIHVHNEIISDIPHAPCIIATGPLTDGAMLEAIKRLMGDGLHFYDAAAPIVSFDSLDMSKIFRSSRYGKGDDYLNCPMNRMEYFMFIRAITEAETAVLHEFEAPRVFEGCMPVEVMAKRGDLTLAYGPLKPVGLVDPKTGKQPFAVVQLRMDNAEGTLYNIVGFQTNLKFGEQRRVFGMIPGLEKAEFIRYGVMHRNTFIDSPGKLTPYYSAVGMPKLYFAGQLTGVEGYIESASSGLVAGINLANTLNDRAPVDFGRRTAIGSLAHYVSEYNGGDFQPMNVTYGIMEPIANAPQGKRERYSMLSRRALEQINMIVEEGVL